VRNRFDGKVIVITGAVGGIGAAACRLFAREGAHVVVSDLDEKRCAALAAELNADGASADYVAADLKQKTACEMLVETTIERHAKVDVLVNNAGIIPRGDILNTTDDMWHDAFAVNMHALFYLSRAVIPYMRDAGGGAVVNTSSTWGIHPGPNHVAYVTTKGAVASFTKSLARDCAPLNIRVNAVAPNEVNTPMLRSGFEIRGLEPDEAITALNQTVPLGRIAEPEEVASTVLFLASEEASYICGAVVEISGAKAVYG